MDLESVSLKLPRDLLSDAQRVATARDVTVGHLVRQLLKREVDRQLAGEGTHTTDARLLAALRALLSRDVAEAHCWDNLAERLRPHGYGMRPSGGGLELFKTSCGSRICEGSEIGFAYVDLVKRFGAAMPEYLNSTTQLGVMPAGRIDATRQKMLQGHFAAARSWPDLINRLAIDGMELRPMGAGIGIYVSATGRHLCNAGAVGARYQTLVKRYGAAMPGHPHDVSEYLSGQEPVQNLQLIARG